MVQTILKSRSSSSISSQSVVPLGLPIGGPDEDPTIVTTTEPIKDEIKSKRKRKEKGDGTKDKGKKEKGKKDKGEKDKGEKDKEKNDVENYLDPTKCYDEYQKKFVADEEEKTFKCFHIRLGLSDLCKIITLWFLIGTLALSIQIVERIFPKSKSKQINTDITTCLLCPAGQSVTDPHQEVILTDFECSAMNTSLEPKCFFECPDSLPSLRVYTCGEVEQLAQEASNNCSDGADSCRIFQQADTQCCN